MHTTEFGLCTHSYIDEPCLKYRNCLNCTEHVCIKGDVEKKKRLQDRLKKEKILWAKDKESVSKNVTGATVWLEMSEPYRVCRRPSFLRECPDEKSKIYP